MKGVLLLLFLLPLCSLAQMQDNFSDGDFTANPAWSGDTGQFIVNINHQLQLNASAPGSSFLSTTLSVSLADSMEWRFWIRMNFSPSVQNYARIYLMADNPNLKGALNGYYLQFGENLSNDAVELFRQSGTTSSSVCRGTNGRIASSFSIGVKIVRDTAGLWSLWVDSTGGTDYIQEAQGVDTTYKSSSHFGLVCTYTSGNISNYYFDDFYAGAPLPPPPPLSQQPDPGDVIINEVLFSVSGGGAEFAELYNRSGKVIDLKDLQVTKLNLKTRMPDNPVSLSTATLLLPPDNYMVLTKDVSKVKSRYYTSNPSAFLQISLPDLLTNEDILLLSDKKNRAIDMLHYSSSWHFPLLNDVHDVSLERLNPNRPTNDSTNWHSAAESAGFATPGYRNSQYHDIAGGGDDVLVVPELFSPDNDGKDDVVNIFLRFNEPGYVANAKVFDSKGRDVRILTENQLLGTESALSWDGLTDRKEKARTGIYIIYIQVFDMKGTVKEYKKTCVLATRL